MGMMYLLLACVHEGGRWGWRKGWRHDLVKGALDKEVPMFLQTGD